MSPNAPPGTALLLSLLRMDPTPPGALEHAVRIAATDPTIASHVTMDPAVPDSAVQHLLADRPAARIVRSVLAGTALDEVIRALPAGATLQPTELARTVSYNLIQVTEPGHPARSQLARTTHVEWLDAFDYFVRSMDKLLLGDLMRRWDQLYNEHGHARMPKTPAKVAALISWQEDHRVIGAILDDVTYPPLYLAAVTATSRLSPARTKTRTGQAVIDKVVRPALTAPAPGRYNHRDALTAISRFAGAWDAIEREYVSGLLQSARVPTSSQQALAKAARELVVDPGLTPLADLVRDPGARGWLVNGLGATTPDAWATFFQLVETLGPDVTCAQALDAYRTITGP